MQQRDILANSSGFTSIFRLFAAIHFWESQGGSGFCSLVFSTEDRTNRRVSEANLRMQIEWLVSLTSQLTGERRWNSVYWPLVAIFGDPIRTNLQNRKAPAGTGERFL